MTGMARPANLSRRFARVVLPVAVLACTAFGSTALADQKVNQEPVRTTMPAGASTHESKFMMAPVMSADERQALYLQWGLTFAGIFIAVGALVVWIFLNTRKEAGAPAADEDENAYTVPVQSVPEEQTSEPSVTKSTEANASPVVSEGEAAPAASTGENQAKD